MSTSASPVHRLPAWVPLRYTTFCLSLVGSAGLLVAALVWGGLWWWLGFGVCAALALLGVRDMTQVRHSVLRNYPIIGHLRFLLEFIRPEMRQYFIESDHEALPFSRAQRSLVYQRAKGDPDSRPLGTQLNVTAQGYEWVNHSMQPTRLASHDFRITIGCADEGASPCTQPYSASIFNISAMSFGALSANAILALNKGAKMGGFAHDTGEGSISQHHRVHGGDLIWEVASGYFGCRNDDGTFSEEKFIANATDPQVKLIEIKLSQGAKPGHGGMLLGAKVTPRSPRAACPWAWTASALQPQRLQDAGGDDAFHRPPAREVGRQAHGLQVLRGPSLGVVRHRQGHAGDGHHAGLHRGRWRRGRHGRGARGVHRPRGRAAAGRPAAGAQHADRRGPAPPHQDRCGRQGDHGLRHRAHDGAGRRLVQRRARLHDGPGLHPGAELPHRPLPHGRGHAGRGAPEGPGRARQGHARGQLP